MRGTSLSLAITTAISLATMGSVQAHGEPPVGMEKCIPVNKQGVNIIKKGHSDCGSGKSACAGLNVAHEKEAWITVPKGTCEQIHAGNWQAVPQNVCDRLEDVNSNNCKK
jgi:uncharacterized membrane protein